MVNSKNAIPQFVSQMQLKQLGVGGTWNHVGIVWPSKYIDFPNKRSGELYSWEAVISGMEGTRSPGPSLLK